MNILSTESFKEEDLVKVYAPPNLLSVMPGNKVMLRSGGPKMTVIDQVGDTMAEVMWEYEEGKTMTHIFNLTCLTCFGAE